MKTKFLKVGMPIMVFILAIAFAFATEKTTAESVSSSIPGYIFENGQCKPASRTCENTGGPVCKQGSLVVHQFTNASNTICSFPMTNWGL